MSSDLKPGTELAVMLCQQQANKEFERYDEKQLKDLNEAVREGFKFSLQYLADKKGIDMSELQMHDVLNLGTGLMQVSAFIVAKDIDDQTPDTETINTE